jgi:hypothetical protein
VDDLSIDNVFVDDAESVRRFHLSVGDAGRVVADDIDEGRTLAEPRTALRFDNDVVQIAFLHFFRQRLRNCVRIRGKAARSKPHNNASLALGAHFTLSGRGLFDFSQLGKTSDFGYYNHTLTLQTL